MYKIYFTEVKTKTGQILPDLYLPILPEKLKESCSIENQKFNMLAVGETVKPGATKLKTWEISSVYEGGQEISVASFVKYIEDMAESPERFLFIINKLDVEGGELYSMANKAILESYSYEDRAGEPGDIYYELKLIEYRPHEGATLA